MIVVRGNISWYSLIKQKYEDVIKELISRVVEYDCVVCHAFYTCDKENRKKCEKSIFDEYMEDINEGLK